MKSIFNDSAFIENGFKVIDLVDPSIILNLRSVYKVIPKNKNQGFYTSLNFEHKHERTWVDSQLKEIVFPQVKAFLPGYTPFIGSFTIKKMGEASDLALHLDWSITDETKHKAIGVWIPLCDTTANNGALGLLRGSHQFGYSVRGSLINFLYAPGAGPRILGKIAEKYKPVEIFMTAGKAVIYDLSLAHFSRPNLSQDERIAINLILIPEEASTYHFKKEGSKIYQIPVTSSGLLSNYFGSEIPSGSSNFISISDEKDLEEQHLNITQLDEIEQVYALGSKIRYSFWKAKVNEFRFAAKFKKFKKAQS